MNPRSNTEIKASPGGIHLPLKYTSSGYVFFVEFPFSSAFMPLIKILLNGNHPIHLVIAYHTYHNYTGNYIDPGKFFTFHHSPANCCKNNIGYGKEKVWNWPDTLKENCDQLHDHIKYTVE